MNEFDPDEFRRVTNTIFYGRDTSKTTLSRLHLFRELHRSPTRIRRKDNALNRANFIHLWCITLCDAYDTINFLGEDHSLLRSRDKARMEEEARHKIPHDSSPMTRITVVEAKILFDSVSHRKKDKN